MALNGGVSLAVWMGGCAVELDAARRAHLGPEDLRVDAGDAVDDAPPGDARTIYHALCDAFDRELVIDLMSGSSAGGINGALLAAAICSRQRLHPDFIRDKWVTLGDFETLIHPLKTKAPTSLMGGARFHAELLRTFQELLPTDAVSSERGEEEEWQSTRRKLGLPAAQDAERGRLIDQAGLEVTATDVKGDDQSFRDAWGETLIATEYRQRFCFRAGDYTAESLANAARASASFPLAFEPWAVKAGDIGLDGGWRWMIDGGLLDNAPIRAVLERVPARSADRPVKRFLCYVNADPPLKPTFATPDRLDDPNDPDKAAAAEPAGDGAEANGAAVPTATRPQLQDVISYMISLPRKAGFVDQMRAVQTAVSRSTTVDRGLEPLLALDQDALDATAAALFVPYRSRRRLRALEDMLSQPSDVQLAAARLAEDDRELPWIPRTLEAPVRPDRPMGEDPGWGWGARAAERVLFLMLDVIRRRLDHAALPAERREPLTDQEVVALQDARRRIYRGLRDLESAHDDLTHDPKIVALVQALSSCEANAVDSVLCALGCLMKDPDRDPAVRRIVEDAAQATFDVRASLGTVPRADGEVPVARVLFGPAAERPDAELRPAQLRRFLERTLKIEVVRRAYAAEELVESEQPLAFAQLTPCAPTLIYTHRPMSCTDGVPSTAAAKLTGTRWGHFAGFYRASWRANDFMWGRLDGAVRVVDMLLDPDRCRPERRDDGTADRRAEVLAAALLPEQCFDDTGGERDTGSERRRLVAEALADALRLPERERVREHEWRAQKTDELAGLPRETLVTMLTSAIADDLDRGVEGHGRGELTRVLCIRAAQWEVLRREIAHVVRQSREDVGLGTSMRALKRIPAKDESWWQAIVALRGDEQTLAQRLGAGVKSEEASALMIRTAARGGLVGLSALRETKLPGSAALVLPRALLLPIAGMVDRKSWPYPLAVALAFWSFALLIAARMITLQPGTAPEKWDFARWLSVGVTLLAVVGVAMVCLVPIWRLSRNSNRWRKAVEAVAIVALVAAGGGIAIGWHLFDGVALSTLIGQRGAEAPMTWAAGLALGVVGFFKALPRLPYGSLRSVVTWLQEAPWRGWVSLVAFFLPWAILGGWALGEVVFNRAFGIEPADQRQHVTALVALFAPVLVAFAYIMLSIRRRAGTVFSRRAFKSH